MFPFSMVTPQRGESGKTNWTVTEPPKKKGECSTATAKEES
jgi:hypothetical protein